MKATYLMFLTAAMCAVVFMPRLSAEESVLTVSASAKESFVPSLATVRLSVEVRAEEVEDARRDLEEKANRLTRFLRDEEVDRLETTALRLTPVYSYDRQRQTRKIDGYQGTVTVSFRTGVTRAGVLAGRAIGEGANRIESINFTATEDEMEEIRGAALRTAATRARQRGETVLDELGLSLDRIVGIEAHAPDGPPVWPMRSEMAVRAVADDAEGFEVEPGEQEVEARVTLRIRFK